MSGEGGAPVLVEDLRGPRRLVARARREWSWGRSHGWAALVDEHDLDPVVRVSRAVRRWRWRRAHPGTGPARPVFVVGVQRSGTNAVAHALGRSPEVLVYNEGDRRAFRHFRLRPDPVILRLVESSRHPVVLFKPLCDSHRVDHLLDGLGTSRRGLAVWVYRRVDGRVRSAVERFGDANLRVLQELAAAGAGHRWQVQRLTPDSVALVRRLDPANLSPASGAALMWYLRNVLYFELGLDRRDDVTLLSYDRLLADPEGTMRSLCSFLGVGYDPRMVDRLSPRRPVEPQPIDPRIRARCEELQELLDRAAGRIRAGAGGPPGG